jgi:hypothetical protein
MAPNRPARPVSTSHLSTAASPASPDIGGSVGELHELYDQLGAGASAIRDFQLAGIPLALQTMRYTGAQSEARATATGRPVDRTGRNPDLAAWVRNANARAPELLAAQRRERARVRAEKQRRWGRPATTAA